MTDDIDIALSESVQTLRLARPDKKNALTTAMYDALAGALEAANGDDGIAVNLVLGSPGIFCAGNDIGDFMRIAAEGHGLGASILRFLRALATSEKPLVAGVDGAAIGLGTTLLLHCDHVVVSDRAVFVTPFVDLALVPEAASSLIAPRLMGHVRAFELLVMGRQLTAEAALQAGLVNRVVAPKALEAAAGEAAAAIAAKPRQSMMMARRLIKGDPAEILERIDAEAECFAERLSSAEAQAAFATFLQKGKS
jgi:enoyl-CoA hydratase/carnithine racemase